MTACAACGESIKESDTTAKDKKGRLFHKACAQRLLAERAARKAAAAEAEADPMAALLDDVQPAAEPDRCPSCSTIMPDGAVVCAQCSYNTQTGETASTRVRSVPKGVSGAAQGAASVSSAWMLALIGSAVGGAIGAAIWAGVAYFMNLEIGWLAAGVGALAGFGASLGAQSRAGVVSGLIACAVALASLFGGKMLAVQLSGYEVASDMRSSMVVVGGAWMTDEEALIELVDDDVVRRERQGESLRYAPGYDYWSATELSQYPPRVVRDQRAMFDALSPADRDTLKRKLVGDNAVASMADDECFDRTEAGETLDWPGDMTYVDAFMIEDYPPEIIARKRAEWDSWTEAQQVAYINAGIESYADFIESSDAAVSFMGAGYDTSQALWDGLWALLALAAAFGTGAKSFGEP